MCCVPASVECMSSEIDVYKIVLLKYSAIQYIDTCIIIQF